MNTLHDYKTEKLAKIISLYHHGPIKRILVVGCGSGLEAAVLATSLDAQVIGIDISNNFDFTAAKIASLEVGDATCLRFSDSSFDFVYSFHALEHINNYVLALNEMKRVLKDTGGYLIGTPNRFRLIGYIGSRDATLKQKIRWNIADWKARLTGNFKNELGAHAGFSKSELKNILKAIFGNAKDISYDYYVSIYPKKRLLISLLQKTYLSNIVYPSIYFIGTARAQQ